MKRLVFIVSLAVIATLAYFVIAVRPPAGGSSASGGPPVSADGARPAPAFTARTLDGNTLSLNALQGKAVILDFWATWCGPCRFAMPHLDSLQTRYAGEGLVVLGISLDETGPDRVESFVDKLGVTFPIAMANDAILADYGPLQVLPTTFFIDRQGNLVRRVVGYVGEETLEAYAQEIVR